MTTTWSPKNDWTKSLRHYCLSSFGKERKTAGRGAQAECPDDSWVLLGKGPQSLSWGKNCFTRDCALIPLLPSNLTHWTEKEVTTKPKSRFPALPTGCGQSERALGFPPRTEIQLERKPGWAWNLRAETWRMVTWCATEPRDGGASIRGRQQPARHMLGDCQGLGSVLGWDQGRCEQQALELTQGPVRLAELSGTWTLRQREINRHGDGNG